MVKIKKKRKKKRVVISPQKTSVTINIIIGHTDQLNYTSNFGTLVVQNFIATPDLNKKKKIKYLA